MRSGHWPKLVLILFFTICWSPAHATSEVGLPCQGALALPQVDGIVPSLASCADLDPVTFEAATKESFCSCQEDVFGLVRKAANGAALEQNRHFYLGSELFQQSLNSYGSFLEKIKDFESLYDFAQGEQLDCHLNQALEGGLAACQERKTQLSGFIERSFASTGKAAKEVKTIEEFLRQKSLQLGSESGQASAGSCLSKGLSDDLGKMIVEMIFEDSRKIFLDNKDKINSDEQVDLLSLLQTSLKSEYQAYLPYINSHPLTELLAQKEEARAFVDWLEKNPAAPIYDLFNGKSSHPLALKQKNKFVSMCQQVQQQLGAAVKEGVCGQSSAAVALELPNLGAWLGTEAQKYGANPEEQINRQEAMMARYCAGGGDPNTVLALGAADGGEIRASNDNQNFREDSQFCQQICQGQGSGPCEQKSSRELGEILKTPACEAAGSCLELKALVRLRERAESKRRIHIELGLSEDAPQSVLGRNLAAQGVPATDLPAELERKVAPKRTRSQAAESRPNTHTQNPKALTPAETPEASFSEQFAKSMSDAFMAPADPDQYESDQGLSAAASAPVASTSKNAMEDFAKKQRDRARDEEAKRLRKAIADLEALGDDTKADIDELKDLPIPYARNNVLGEDSDWGDSFNSTPTTYRPAQVPRRSIFAPEEQALERPSFEPRPETMASNDNARAALAETDALAGSGISVTGASAAGRAPAALAGEENGNKSAAATPSLRFDARDLDQLGPELMEQRGLADKEQFMLEVVLPGDSKTIFIPVKKRLKPDGEALWEPQLTSENKEYFERVLEVPLFKDFKLELINSHFKAS